MNTRSITRVGGDNSTEVTIHYRLQLLQDDLWLLQMHIWMPNAKIRFSIKNLKPIGPRMLISLAGPLGNGQEMQ